MVFLDNLRESLHSYEGSCPRTALYIADIIYAKTGVCACSLLKFSFGIKVTAKQTQVVWKIP